ncbi:MAG TPA: hypothetical protein PKY59_07130 [Pyrinomonadaceae bacterium]|nr:hypothetical protein [Pyrinomonadaceae bacterium]
MYRKLFLPFILLLFVHSIFPQTVETKKTDELSEETRKQAVEFLRETAGDINNLRSLENRISFSAEVASIMWFNDEKEAQIMYQAVINDFKQLLYQYDSQLNAMGDVKEEYSGGGIFGGSEPNEKAKLMRKMQKAVSVRQQIISSIAEHDPQLAFDFYETSLNTVTNADMRQRFAGDSYFITRLLSQIAEKDVKKAAELGRKSLADGVNYQHLDLIRKIYAKDADKGAEFAEEVAKKVRERNSENGEVYMLGSVLQMGAENYTKAKKDNKKPMFTEQTLRDLAESLAQDLLKSEEIYATEYLDEIEKFAPSRAVQIRARMNKTPNANRSVYASNRASIAVKSSAANVAVSPVISDKNPETPTEETSPEETLMKNYANLQNKDLPKEEREKIIAKTRAIISALPGRQAKLFALSGLAAEVYKAGDKDLANQIMREAEALVNLQPKNYQEYIEVWLLINGYAQSDASKAFPILEDTVSRISDTINAFVKVAEFMDVQGEIIDDDEIQVGSFGGSMVREITSGLGQTDGVLKNLAKADFARTKAITNRFDKPEIRVLAKMLVLRAVFGETKKTEKGEDEVQF